MRAMQINREVTVSERDYEDGVQTLRDIADTLEDERGIVRLMSRACLIALGAGVLPPDLKRELAVALAMAGFILDPPPPPVVAPDLGGEG
jgi:hypothetical protein